MNVFDMARRLLGHHGRNAAEAARVEALNDMLAAGHERAVTRLARGMSSIEARQVLDQHQRAEAEPSNLFIRRPTASQVEAARRVIADPDSAIARTQPLAVVATAESIEADMRRWLADWEDFHADSTSRASSAARSAARIQRWEAATDEERAALVASGDAPQDPDDYIAASRAEQYDADIAEARRHIISLRSDLDILPSTGGSWTSAFDQLNHARDAGVPIQDLERQAGAEFDRLTGEHHTAPASKPRSPDRVERLRAEEAAADQAVQDVLAERADKAEASGSELAVWTPEEDLAEKRLTEVRQARQAAEREAARESAVTGADHESPDERDRRHAGQARYVALVEDRDAAAQEREPGAQEPGNTNGQLVAEDELTGAHLNGGVLTREAAEAARLAPAEADKHGYSEPWKSLLDEESALEPHHRDNPAVRDREHVTEVSPNQVEHTETAESAADEPDYLGGEPDTVSPKGWGLATGIDPAWSLTPHQLDELRRWQELHERYSPPVDDTGQGETSRADAEAGAPVDEIQLAADEADAERALPASTPPSTAEATPAEHGDRAAVDPDSEGEHMIADTDRAKQEPDGSDDHSGDDAEHSAAEPTRRERFLEQARWAYEHADQIEREADRARERGDISGAYEWSGQARNLRNSARGFEREARALGPDADSSDDTGALGASFEQARWSHERALRIEREVDQMRERGDIPGAWERGGQARMLRHSARAFERDARTAGTGGFGFVGPPASQPGGDSVDSAVNSARDAVNDVGAQRANTARERADYDRAQQTNLWATRPHDDDLGRGAGGGLSAEGRTTSW